MGFAPFYGGLLRYGEARGLTEIASRMNAISKSADVRERNSGRFDPAPTLLKAAAGAGNFR